MKRLGLVLIGLALAGDAYGDFKTDKAECEEWGKAFYIIASWRPTLTKVEAYDKVVSINQDNPTALADAVKIVWVAYDLEGTDEEIKKAAIKACMKQRGYTGV